MIAPGMLKATIARPMAIRTLTKASLPTKPAAAAAVVEAAAAPVEPAEPAAMPVIVVIAAAVAAAAPVAVPEVVEMVIAASAVVAEPAAPGAAAVAAVIAEVAAAAAANAATLRGSSLRSQGIFDDILGRSSAANADPLDSYMRTHHPSDFKDDAKEEQSSKAFTPAAMEEDISKISHSMFAASKPQTAMPLAPASSEDGQGAVVDIKLDSELQEGESLLQH